MIASRYVLRRLFVLIVVIYWIKLPEFSLTLLSRSNARVAPLIDGFILSILNHNVRFTVHENHYKYNQTRRIEIM